MTLVNTLIVVGILASATFWWVFFLERRVKRLEEKAGVRKPPRPLFDD